MTEILLEKKLTTDFTMGFELECIWNTNEESAGDYFDRWFPGGDLHGDGSVNPSRSRGGEPIEWASPVLPVNIASIEKIIGMYRDGLGDKFYVNDSCGYHHHISFPGITAEDMVWIMCKLATDSKMRRKISKFKGIEFVGEWSGDEYLDELKEAVKDDNYRSIVSLCNTEKYSLVNVHAGNTLEWRGPRGFLNDENIDVIIQFYKRFWEFIKWMTDALDETEINNVSKENFLAQVRAAMGNRRDINGWRFPAKKRTDGLLDDVKLQEICKKIVDDPAFLLKFINQKPLEQILQRLYNTNRLGLRIKAINGMEEDKVPAEAKKKINNIAYKYIPYRILASYADTLTTDAVYNTSELTMKRYLNTSRFDGRDVFSVDKLTLLSNNAELFNPDIFKKKTCPDIYNWDGWDLSKHLALFKVLIAQGYTKDFSDDAVKSMADSIYNKDSQHTELYLKLLLSAFGDRPGFGKTIAADIMRNFGGIDPEAAIPMLNVNYQQVIWMIGKIYASGNYVEDKLNKLHKALIDNNKITEDEWLRALQMFHRSHEVNDVDAEDEEVQGLEGRDFNPED